MKWKFHEVVDAYTKEKSSTDGFLTRVLYRPLSYPVSYAALCAGMMPNTVTYISIICCAGGFLLSFFPAAVFQLSAIVCFFLFAVLDCADGNMARAMNNKGITRKNAAMGSWVDAVGGYCAYTAELLSMGISAAFSVSVFRVEWFIQYSTALVLIAGIAAAANMLMRAVVQSYKIAADVDTRKAAGSTKRFSEEIGITGFMPIAYLAGFITGFLPVVLSVYALIYTGGCFVTVVKLIYKVEKHTY